MCTDVIFLNLKMKCMRMFVSACVQIVGMVLMISARVADKRGHVKSFRHSHACLYLYVSSYDLEEIPIA